MADIIDTKVKKIGDTPGTVDQMHVFGRKPTAESLMGAPLIPQANPTPFREDIQKDKDRESKENVQTIKTLGDAMKNLDNQPFDPLEGSDKKPAPAFQSFQDTLRQQNPDYRRLQQATTNRAIEDLNAAPAGLGEQTRAIAMSDLARSMEAARIQQKGEAIKAFGPGTGQVGNVMRDFDTQSILQNQDLAGRLAVEDAGLKEQQKATAMSNALAAMGRGTEAEQLQLQTLQAGEQSAQFKAAQALERYGIDAKIKAEQLMQTSDQEFKTRLQQQGYMNDRDIEEYRAGVEMQLTQMGFDQQTAMQVAQFQQEKLMQANEQKFVADLDAIDKQWRTGERIDAQTFESTIQNLNRAHDETMFNLNKNLQLDLQGNKQAFEDAQMKASMAHDYAINQLGYDQEQALQHSQQVFTERMTQLGFNNDQALQASDAINRMAMLNREIDSKENMLAVEMAMQDKQFAAELGLKEKDLVLRRDSLNSDIKLQTEKLDLDRQTVEAALKTEKVQNDMSMVSIAMELMPNNAAALEPFTDRLFQTLATEMGIDPAKIEEALSGTGTGGEAGFRATGDISTDAPAQLNDYLYKIENEMDKYGLGLLDDTRKYLQGLTKEGWEPILDDINIMNKLKKQGLVKDANLSTETISRAGDVKAMGLNFKVALNATGRKNTSIDDIANKNLPPSIVIVDGIPYELETFDYYNKKHKGLGLKSPPKAVKITGKNLLNNTKETIMDG